MKDFAKSIVCNTKAEAEKVGNFEDPKKAKYYIEMWERRRDDAKRSLQNAEGHLKEAMKHRYGDKEFNQREVQRYQEAVKAAEASIKQYDDLIKSAAKTSFGNTRTGNSYSWTQRRGHQEFYDPAIPFGGHVRGYVEKSKNGYTGAKTNGPIVIEQKEFATEAEAKKFVENKQTGNTKVGNADILSGNYIILADNGEVWFRDEHENVHIRNIDSWAQKRIASYQSSIDEIKKGVAEAKQAAKKAGMI